MTSKYKLKQILQSDWFCALLLVGIYFITHGYRYAWDDQNLEIPLLKSFIDPSLYLRDYYIQSLKNNYISYFFPLLSKIITIDLIPTTYLILNIISRYFFFFWIYKIWLLLSKDKLSAFLCSFSFIVISRVEEFLLLSFSNTEFTLAISFAGLYFFYKERFVLSAMILGIAANFHALYSLMPMIYVASYLFFGMKKHGWKTFLKTCLTYIVFISPLLIWIYKKSLTPPPPEIYKLGVWLPLFKKCAAEMFIFSTKSFKELYGNFGRFIVASNHYLFLLSLYLFNCVHNKDFRRNGKNHAIVLTGFLLIVIAYLAGYVYYNRFILVLNLFRNRSFLFFVLMSYFTLTCIKIIDKEKPWIGFFAGIILIVSSSKDIVSTISICLITVLLSIKDIIPKKRSVLKYFFLSLLFLCIPLLIFFLLKTLYILELNPFGSQRFIILCTSLLIILTLAYIPFLEKHKLLIKRLFILSTLVLFTFWFTQKHIQRINKKSVLDIVLANWIDMQNYVRENTPKSALLLVPYNVKTGGFRIFSERSIVCCKRDRGIVGFDYYATLEWERRIKDIKKFKIQQTSSVKSAVVNAIKKYDVDYIVFTTRVAPQPNKTLQLIYANRLFALYKVAKTVQ